MENKDTGYTCLKHELFNEVAKDLSPAALITLTKILTYQDDFIIRANYLAKQLGLKQSKYMTPRMAELVEKGYLFKNGAGEFTEWEVSHKAKALTHCPYGDYFRLENDAIERLATELNDAEMVVYLHMLTNALTHKMTNKEIEDRTGINKKSLSRHLNHLHELGFIERKEAGYNIVYWTINRAKRENYIVIDNDIHELYSTYAA